MCLSRSRKQAGAHCFAPASRLNPRPALLPIQRVRAHGPWQGRLGIFCPTRAANQRPRPFQREPPSSSNLQDSNAPTRSAVMWHQAGQRPSRLDRPPPRGSESLIVAVPQLSGSTVGPAVRRKGHGPPRDRTQRRMRCWSAKRNALIEGDGERTRGPHGSLNSCVADRSPASARSQFSRAWGPPVMRSRPIRPTSASNQPALPINHNSRLLSAPQQITRCAGCSVSSVSAHSPARNVQTRLPVFFVRSGRPQRQGRRAFHFGPAAALTR